MRGYRVIANDWEPYAQAINHAFIQVNQMPDFAALGGPDTAFAALNTLPPKEGYVTAHLCPADDTHPDLNTERMFFTRANGLQIDAMRDLIQEWQDAGQITDDEWTVLLATLLYAASYVSNTSGLFKGFHRGWGGQTGTALYRILSEINLRPPVLWDNGQDNQVFQQDAQTLAETLRDTGQAVDIAYLDPPYNQHPYGSNYHILNTLTLWDCPPLSPRITVGDKSAIRTDWRTDRRSAYNHRTALDAYQILLSTLDARFILTSYSTDGNIPLPALLSAAAERGQLEVVTHSYKRYRVSTQRMSSQPTTVEFVLIINTREPGDASDADRVEADIRRALKSDAGLKSTRS